MVGAYLRKSNDDKESDSIINQRKVVDDYAKNNNTHIDVYYVDRAASGFVVDESFAFFDRVDYNRMIEDLKNGRLKKVLLKDHTRLGRHAGPLLVAIEIFHHYKCKLIDCAHNREIKPGDIRNHLDALFGEQYVNDISDKVRCALAVKQKDGTLVMSHAYGFIKKHKNQLFVDEKIRPCIELIYSLYIGGMGYYKIARYLNEKTHYPTPSQYRSQQKTTEGKVYRRAVADKWQGYHVSVILSDLTYTGVLVTRKTQSAGVHGKVTKTAKEDRYYFPGHHEAMVSAELFETAQEIRKKRRNTDYRGSAQHDYIFSGFCVCADCGGNVSGRTVKRKAGRIPGYNCGKYTHAGKSGCVNKEIPETELLAQFKSFLTHIRGSYAEFLASVDITEKINRDSETLHGLKRQHTVARKELATLVMQRAQAITAEPEETKAVVAEAYAEAESILKERIVKLSGAIDVIGKTTDNDVKERIRSALEHMDMAIASLRPDRRLLEALLDKIVIHSGRIVEFVLKVDIQENVFASGQNVG